MRRPHALIKPLIKAKARQGELPMSTKPAPKRRVPSPRRRERTGRAELGKGLFLGDIRLDVVYPQPKLPAEEVAKGEQLPRHLA